MCILSFLPPEATVDVNGLWNGGINNPHGHGWAIVETDRVVVGKSLDLAEALESFVAARERHPAGPALFHSRWATHGSVNLPNVHPFVVGGSELTVVAHNGILPTEAHPAKGDDRSDSRKFADEILPTRFRRLDRRRAHDALSRWCGRANKLVILTADPRYQRNSYVINESLGRWDAESGMWHSNEDYLGGVCQVGSSSVGGGVAGGHCDLCWWGEVDEQGYCGQCRSCTDCYEHIRDCLCWNREVVRSERWGELVL
ncbi:class II glutamine amidotransferase [Mycolicibacterium chlorophenolicum]|uniref:Glucosamine--fructose-6-phosphate aminotransferase n=1 Tax=Mycolicibacterium chlorophenolicum TaxID=37916 RepID=A0A0J6ZD82_9MYCO|nr:class II glutamine amidotransferase [Mycolicibacterium chlorophenolicum]KMO82696.1 glucosamine--fructose-6-phosphate aminotransferase [Mycolicibacterium chlorophenolicum]